MSDFLGISDLEQTFIGMDKPLIVGVDEVGMGCERIDAKVLTQMGYKRYNQLSLADEVLSYDKQGKLFWQKIKKIYYYDKETTLLDIKLMDGHVVVTSNHKFVMEKRRFGTGNKRGCVTGYTQVYQTLDECSGQCYIPRTGLWVGETVATFVLPTDSSIKIPMTDWLAFFGLWITEGCATMSCGGNYKVIISQFKKENIIKIKELLDKLPWSYSYYEKSGNFTIHSKALYTYLVQFGKSNKKFIPTEIKNLSKDLLNILFDWLILGDGSILKPTGGHGKATLPTISYYTASKKLAADVEEIITKLGYSFHTKARKGGVVSLSGGKYKSKRVHYTIRLCRFNKYSTVAMKHCVTRKQGRYKVFCLELEEAHNFFVRRDGWGYFTGNSLSGPLVATAAILNYNDLPNCIKDSKFYSNEDTRLAAYDELTKKVPLYATYVLDVAELNNIADISKAGYLTRYRAVEKLFWKLFLKKMTPHAVLVDAFDLYGIDIYNLGNTTEFEINGRPTELLQLVPELITQGVAKGDSTVACIAAASVIAKVERDAIVKEHDRIYPEYKWADNKGYGTKEHLEAIKKYGITRYHRTWYKPCVNAKRRIELDVPIVKEANIEKPKESKNSIKAFNTIKLFHNIQNSQVNNDNSEGNNL